MAQFLLPRYSRTFMSSFPRNFRHSSKPLVLHSNSNFCSQALTEELNNIDVSEVDLNNSNIQNPKKVDKSDLFGSLRIPMEKYGRPVDRCIKNGHIKHRTGVSKMRKSNILATPRTSQAHNVDSSDTFGDLANQNPLWRSTSNQAENEEEEYEELSGGIKSEYPLQKTYKQPQAYLRQMKLLVKQKKLKEALELFPDMKKNKVFPIHANYTFMIGACGRVGYTEMAFKLLKQMNIRGFRPTPATLTGLFNSCAEGPFPDYGLKNARYLQEKIAEKNWLLSAPTYHAMIKCFGKCGDIQSAFELVDEMSTAGFPVTTETYSFLLMSCISDKVAGFTYAVEVWRKLLAKKLHPCIFIFNLILRAVRDCNVGPEEISLLLLQHWSSYRKRPYGLNEGKQLNSGQMLRLPDNKVLALEAGANQAKDELVIGTTMDVSSSDNGTTRSKVQKANPHLEKESIQSLEVPTNILAKRPIDGPMVVELSSITTSSARFALVGNADGFLNLMDSFGVKPDIKTFTLMLQSQSSNEKNEDHLLTLMNKYKVSPDIDFFNLMIKKRKLRKNHIPAKNVLHLINKYNLSPDIITFGVLALECHGSKCGLQLLENMNQLGFHPNVEIMGALIHAACVDWNLPYLQTLLIILKSEDVKMNQKITSTIETCLQKMRESIIATEHGKPWERPQPFEDIQLQYQKFCDFYANFLKSVDKEENEHPWHQYETEIIYQKTKKYLERQ